MSTTLLALQRHIARTKDLGYMQGSPSETGSTTTIVDSSSDSPFDADDSERLLDNAWVKIEADSAGTPLNVGEVRRLKAEGGYSPSTNTLTWNRAMSNATTTTMTAGVYLGVPPTRQGLERGLDEYINDVLRSLRYRDYALLTLVTDGDMETSGVTNWTASNSTLTKSTTAGYVFQGKQALRVVNSAANGYARSALIPVTETQTFCCLADVRVSSGTAKLQLYDETNSAEIDSVTTAELRRGYLWIDNTTIPTDCKQVSVRLIGTGASDDIYWDNVSLRNNNATEMDLPSWFLDKKWLEELVYTYGGNTEQDNDLYFADERYENVVHYRRVLDAIEAANPFKVEFRPRPPSSSHLFARCLRPYAELSADSDTTMANQDWVRAWAMTLIMQDKDNEERAKYWYEQAMEKHNSFAPTWKGRAFVAHRDI